MRGAGDPVMRSALHYNIITPACYSRLSIHSAVIISRTKPALPAYPNLLYSTRPGRKPAYRSAGRRCCYKLVRSARWRRGKAGGPG